MKTVTESRTSRTLGRVKQIWSEFDYAQRRLFEIRTGIPATAPENRPRIARRADELERLYAYTDPRFGEC
jgi:hypothetical protein